MIVTPTAPPGSTASEPSAELTDQTEFTDPTGPVGLSAQTPSALSAEPVRPVDLPDALIEVARAAVRTELGINGTVGDYLGAFAEDAVAVTASFAATERGYRGWRWSVTIAQLEPGLPTLSEVVLLPGTDALLAPAWVPWSERVRGSDLGPGDLLPTTADDPRLVPAYVASDDPAVEEVAKELGLGRVRVMSREGRIDITERWHEGRFGPTDEMALQAPAPCVACAFYLPIAGSLGAAFGACGNEFSPAEGRVVDAGYGCGAHSEVVVELPPLTVGESVIDELRLEVHERSAVEPDAAGAQPAEQSDHAELTGLSETESSEPAELSEPAGSSEPAAAIESADGAGLAEQRDLAEPSEPADQGEKTEPVEVVAQVPLSESAELMESAGDDPISG